MSLFGTYIEESSVGFIDESYYQNYDYFSEAFERSFNEMESFYYLVSEKVDIKAGLNKFVKGIKAAVGKLIEMIRALLSKIKGFFSKLFSSEKEVDEAVKEAKQAQHVMSGHPVSEARSNKANSMIKTTVFIDLKPDALKAIYSIPSPKSMSLDFDKDSNVANNKIMTAFNTLSENEGKGNTIELTATNIEGLAKHAMQVAKSLKGFQAQLKKLEGYQKDAEAMAKEIDQKAAKLENQQLNDKKIDNKELQKLQAQVKLLTAYEAGCSKVVKIFSKVSQDNINAAARLKMISKTIIGDDFASGVDATKITA